MKLLSALLLPLSLIYSLIITLKKLTIKKKSFGIKVFSVGNLVVGGSGKTPLTKALYLLLALIVSALSFFVDTKESQRDFLSSRTTMRYYKTSI